jgi:hypothetical protein
MYEVQEIIQRRRTETSQEEDFWEANAMLRLMDEEYIIDARVPRQITIANGNQARAKVIVQQPYDGRGGRGGKVLVERPSTHKLYATTFEWKNGLQKVLENMCAADVEAWLCERNSMSVGELLVCRHGALFPVFHRGGSRSKHQDGYYEIYGLPKSFNSAIASSLLPDRPSRHCCSALV